MARQVSVDVTDQTDAGVRGVPDASAIRRWVRAALDIAMDLDGDSEVAVLLADQDTVRSLNREYRGKDKPTNVLSFPAERIDGLPPESAAPLGDIVLCPEVIAAEAGAVGKLPADHWAHLCVHGTLHLLGYDHHTVDEASEMEALEVRILADLGVGDPYAAP